MTAITGSQTLIGLGLGSTSDTAVAVGAVGSLIQVESIEFSENAEELRQNPIGSGLTMDSDSQRGATSPSATFNVKAGYNDSGLQAVAQMFGNESINAISGTFYNHSFFMAESRNGRYLTLAAKTTSAGVEELPGGTITSMTITAEAPPNYVDIAFEALFNKITLDSVVNTTATLATATVADALRIVVKDTDEFQLNAQAGGALSSGDQVNIESAIVQFDFPQEHVREIKDSAGNGAPRATGSPPVNVTLTVQLRSLADFTYFTAHVAGTEYKARLNITDATTSSYVFRLDLPRLKIVETPQHPIGQAGDNPFTVTFKSLVATANPTGMYDRYPNLMICNTKSTKYYL